MPASIAADFERALERPATAISARSPSIVVGLVGRGIQQSRTPRMHEQEAARLGLRYVYKLIDTETMAAEPPLETVIGAAELCGFAGLNVTHPYKQSVIAHLTALSDEAAAVGSVNTVVFRDGSRTGHNTDLYGFREAFRRELDDAARRDVLLVGAGGAGAAVAHALLTSGVERLTIADRETDRAAKLAGALAGTFGAMRAAVTEDIGAAMAQTDGVVNATPMGMARYPGLPVPAALLRPPMWVFDIVYFPLETALLAAARAAGCRVVSGAGMAVHQAARAFALFSGATPDADAMTRFFEEA